MGTTVFYEAIASAIILSERTLRECKYKQSQNCSITQIIKGGANLDIYHSSKPKLFEKCKCKQSRLKL